MKLVYKSGCWNFVGYDLGDNDEMFDLINEVDALVTRVVNLIYDVVEEVDVLLHGKKVNVVDFYVYFYFEIILGNILYAIGLTMTPALLSELLKYILNKNIEVEGFLI